MLINMRKGDTVVLDLGDGEAVEITLGERLNGTIKEKHLDISMDAESYEMNDRYEIDEDKNHIDIFI